MNCRKIAAGIVALTLVAGTTGFPETVKHITSGISSMMTADAAVKNHDIDGTALYYYVESGVLTVRKYVDLSEGTVIPTGAFDDYEHPESITKIVIGEGITGIEGNAYDSLSFSNVTELIFPESLTSLGDGSVQLPNLKSVYVPETVGYVSYSAFYIDRSYYNNENFAVVTDNDEVVSLFKAFEEEGLTMPPIASPIANTDLAYHLDSEGTLKVIAYGDKKNTAIPEAYFEKKTDIKNGTNKVVIGDGVTGIGKTAFRSYNMKSVEIADSVKTIGESAFIYCVNIKSITLGSGLETMGDDAFRGTGVKSIDIPGSLKTIGACAFQECSYLEEVTLNYGLTNIGKNAFYETAIKSIKIPNSVETIGDYAFFDCNDLVDVDLGNGVKTIGDNAFGYADEIRSITIPDSVETIGYNAFTHNWKLEELHIGSGVTKIGSSAFKGCPYLTSVEIPDSVTTLYFEAFADCTRLKDSSNGQQHMIDAAGKFSGLVTSNPTAAFIVDRLKAETTPEKIADAMCEKYDAPREVIEADIAKIIGKLRSIGALDE